MPYVPLDRFLLRAPLLPWSTDRKAGKRLLKDPLGALAVAHASPSLAAHPQGEAAQRALARYGRRASFRATPAGLLAGVAMGALGKRTVAATRTPRAHWALAWARVAELGRALLSDATIRSQVRLRRAPSLLEGEDRIRWLAFGEPDGQEREAEIDDRLGRILDVTRNWKRWQDVRGGIDGDGDEDEDGGTSDDEKDELLLLLVRDGLLHHDLTPPLVGPPALDWMIDRLQLLQPALPEADALVAIRESLAAGDIRQARAMLDSLPRAQGDGGRSDRDGAGEGDFAAEPFVATLIHQPAPMVTLDRRVVERAAALAPLLFRLQEALAPPLAERLLDPEPAEAIAAVTELFGEGELDLEALALGSYGIDPAPAFDRADPDWHAGPAATSPPPPALVRLLIDQIMSACAARRVEIMLDTRALDSILPPFTPPGTCELFLAPRAANVGWLLGLHAPAGSTWGRFATALGEPLLDALANLNEVEVAARPDQLRLDVAYAPSEGAADLCTAPHVRPQMLALSTWPANEDEASDEDEEDEDETTDHGEGISAEAITAADLMLVSGPGLDEPTLTFAGLAAVPSPLTRVRSTTAPPGIFRMLAGASFHRQHGPWAVSLGALADLEFVPRIWIDEFVVSPASWRLPPRLDARRLRALRRDAGHGLPPLPRFVQVGNQDELLPVDLDGPDALGDLAGQVRVWEIWPPVDEPALDQQGRRLEAVIALVDQPDVAAGAATVARARALATAGPVPPPRYVPAAEGWRSFKLFGVETRQNDVLLAVREAVHAARDAGEIDGWFFVRYADDRGARPHLRLRVHTGAEQRAPLDAFAARLDEALASAREAGLVALVESGPYHPEVARFGGAEVMAIVWRIFTLDSELACGLLGEGDDVDLVDSLVGVFDSLTAGLGFTQLERHEYARGRRDASEALIVPADEDQRRARDADFRERSPRLRALLAGMPADEPLPMLLAAYRDAVVEAAQELGGAARLRIAAPLLHLAAVRLTGTSRELEARAYLLWERTLEGLLRSPPQKAPAQKPPADDKLN